MEAPVKLFVVVCVTCLGNHNVGIYSSRDTACMAAEMMEGAYKNSNIEYWVDEVEFCEIWKE